MHILPSDKPPPSVPLHWHEMHDEIFRVVKGRMIVRIGNESRIYVPEDGEVRIPKGVLHSLNFFSGEECIFEDKTDPLVRFCVDSKSRHLSPTQKKKEN